jgi:hypothetical protein
MGYSTDNARPCIISTGEISKDTTFDFILLGGDRNGRNHSECIICLCRRIKLRNLDAVEESTIFVVFPAANGRTLNFPVKSPHIQVTNGRAVLRLHMGYSLNY